MYIHRDFFLTCSLCEQEMYFLQMFVFIHAAKVDCAATITALLETKCSFSIGTELSIF